MATAPARLISASAASLASPHTRPTSTRIAYRDDTTDNWRSMHPDFVFFHEMRGKIVASILDPHGYHLDDALMKLRALAALAGTYGEAFHEVDSRLKVIDMKTYDVRTAVAVREGCPADVYLSNIASDYSPEKAG